MPHTLRLDDSAFTVTPIAVAQKMLVQFAGRQPWQLVFEIDRARTFLARQMLRTERHQFVHGFCPGRDSDASSTTALTSSPRSLFGTPKTAASTTFG